MRNLLNCERPSPDFTSFKNGKKPRLQKHLLPKAIIKASYELQLTDIKEFELSE
jgi:hypothetical protein